MSDLTIENLVERVQPYTYLTEGRLRTLSRICRYLNANKIPGDIVECGTYKGGSAAVLSKFMGEHRHLWLYDSFEGMPKTTDKDGLEASKWVGECLASSEEVKSIMMQVGTLPERYTIHQGWFHDTFQKPTAQQVALLHCDADWYESVTEVLEKFYPLVPEGGCIVLDDFGYWEGCREAFYDFCCSHNVKPLIERIETDQAFWVKGRTCNRSAISFFLEPSSEVLKAYAEIESLKNKKQEQLAQAQEQLASEKAHMIQMEAQFNCLSNEKQLIEARLVHFKKEVSKLQTHLSKNQKKREKLQTKLGHLRKLLKESRKSHGQLREDLQGQLRELTEKIANMESSKFWKMRNGWIKFKQRLGLDVR
jgi:O-methyltransferase